ncbi:hypothetical protein M406DRAFT_35669 [Cryphonectria parasitica EP155]|uniref:PEBP-like protein n=1 Tax=Cryphonectria parasitica (strain ATCC 38755 / EP155) TaxID=660469 RepID=A0A9P4YB58_CRYP1|nr:uncharacterized protein M406DRAFT_35669 [Cryphonectria parasitica EP155]KAF3769677.1 hypothetical protein M406DRAFT_35669 [Cryphonectria parasitica EP155]
MSRALLEVTISWLFANARGRDDKCFNRLPAFEAFSEPTIEITSPARGPGPLRQPAQLQKEDSADGAGRLPSLEWMTPTSLEGKVKEWLLVVEDPDAPLPTPISHAIFAGIAATTTRVDHADIEVADDSKNLLKGGFHYGMTRSGKVYIPPRPLMNHGPHRYFHQIVALSEPLPKDLLTSKPQPSREQIAEKIKGNVLGWGLWVGEYERRW